MPETHFEDEVLVPEDANPNTSNAPKYFSKITSLKPEIPLELEVFQKGHDLIEARSD